MRIPRFTLLFISLVLLFMVPALAEDIVPTAAPAPVLAETDTVEATDSAETVMVEATDSTGTPASVSETALELAGSENTVLEMLGVASFLTTETSLSWDLGYCYHDCSTCLTRSDCGGFGCYSVPLC